MILPLAKLAHIATAVHEGKVVIVATCSDGSVFYTIKQDGFEDSFGNTALRGWEDWQPLPFPDENEDPSVAERETKELTLANEPSQYVLRSRFRTLTASAAAPVQLLSGAGHLYLFRQSVNSTLFVDRFVLDGITNRLVRKLEVRFKRSRQKYRPLGSPGRGERGLTGIDSLDYRDADGKPFYEPTLELNLVGTVGGGRFAVVLVPTQEHDKLRWHIFTQVPGSDALDLYSLRASENGLFEVQDETVLEGGGADGEMLRPRSIPGLVHRRLSVAGQVPSGPLAATVFHLQNERHTRAGPQLLRGDMKVLLAFPTSTGVTAALTFAVAIDGMLSQRDEEPNARVLRATERDVLLPLNTLDDIKPLALPDPPPEGRITRVEKAYRGGKQYVRFQTDDNAAPRAGDVVSVAGTTSYDGHYEVARRVNTNVFDVATAWHGDDLGHWKVMPQLDDHLTFNGRITEYRRQPNGALRVTAQSHGLVKGDEVQIVEASDLNGVYPVVKATRNSFEAALDWRPGESVNLKMTALKRRGLQLDGVDDLVRTPPIELRSLAQVGAFGETLCAWVRVTAHVAGDAVVVSHRNRMLRLLLRDGAPVLSVAFMAGQEEVQASGKIPLDEWAHLAAIFSFDEASGRSHLRLLQGGASVAERVVESAGAGVAVRPLPVLGLDLAGGGHVRVASSEALTPVEVSPFTLSAWVNRRGGGAVLAKGLLGAGDQLEYFLGADSTGRVEFLRGGDATPVASDADAVASGQWCHVAAVFDGTSERLFVDGKEVGTRASTSHIAATDHPLLIGSAEEQQSVRREFDGQLAEVRLWNHARSAEQLLRDAKTQLTGDEPGLVGYFPFEGGAPLAVVPAASGIELVGAGQGVPAPVLPSAQQALDIGADGGAFFKGTIADVQVWRIARAPEAVRNSMHLHLTGKESALAGYWRLGGITEGEQRTVADFSVAGNDGVVHGGALVSARSLARTLPGTRKQAVRYLNDELFAVSQRGTYLESFEFRTTPAFDPADVDGNGTRIFSLTYWGASSRRSDEKVRFGGEDLEFQPMGDGWHLAQGRFTVPDGVNLVRHFELSDVQGSWSELEVRRHRVRLVSDTITLAAYQDAYALEAMADQHADLERRLGEFTGLEFRQADLLAEKHELESAIEELEARLRLSGEERSARIAAKQREVDAALRSVEAASRRVAQARGRYDAAVVNPVNYWCKLVSHVNSRYICRIYTQSKGLLFADVGANGNPYYSNNYFRFMPTSHPYFRIGCLYENRVLYAPGAKQHVTSTIGAPHGQRQEWSLEMQRQGWFLIRNRATGQALDVYSGEWNVGIWPFHGGSNQRWNIIRIGGSANGVIERARSELHAAQASLASASRQLGALQAQLAAMQSEQDAELEARLAALRERLRVVEETLARVQSRLTTLNTAYLEALIAAQSTPQSMPIVHEDSRGLVTKGALLGFARPNSRLSVLDSADGCLKLGYFDFQGRMRRTSYDVTSDSRNAFYEQWLPDALAACLDFQTPTSHLSLSSDVALDGDWTLEAWFWHPSPVKGQRRVLAAAADAVAFALVSAEGELGAHFAEGGFAGSGFNLEKLTHGWHHLAVVGREDGGEETTAFFVDGAAVGEPVAGRAGGALKTIGGAPSESAQFGKLAEIRIWNAALSAGEVAACSTSRLSGNEPGLHLYFPLDEAQGNEVRSRAATPITGLVHGASWLACSAPIGNPGHVVMGFDGVSSHLLLDAAANLPDAFTIESWVRVSRPDDGAKKPILSKRTAGNAPRPECELWVAPNGALMFFLGSGDGVGASLDTGVLQPNRWYHVAITVSGNACALYLDGAATAATTFAGARLIETTPILVGTSVDTTGAHFFRGAIGELRVWSTALDPAVIEVRRWRALTPDEAEDTALWACLGADPATRVIVDHKSANRVDARGLALLDDLTLPVGADALVAAEYSTIGRDSATGGQSAMLRECLATVSGRGIKLLPDKRIENLELKWVGNAQFDPTLLGYIEGAPPVPSENLTVIADYNGATSVALSLAEDVEFEWSREQQAGMGASVSLFAGVDSTTFAGIFVESKIQSTHAGFKGDLGFSYSWLNQSTVAAASGTNTIDRLELRGAPEPGLKFPQLGQRFVPKNVGYALVVSGLADVYITRLRRTRRMIGYQVVPNPDIPLDVNTITFMINPAYVMNGSLDGLTGTEATSDRYFRHVPEMRSQFGSLYPASYFRLREAYDLKQQIDRMDTERESYFTNFNSNLVDELSLDREIGADSGDYDTYGNVDLTREEDRGEGDEEENSDAKLARIKEIVGEGSSDLEAEREAKREEIEQKISDTEQRINATAKFAAWQHRMEDLQVRAGKRNIVNNYVWDADGGWRAEAQQFASTVEHMVGGSFSLDAALGGEGNFSIGPVAFALTAQATVHMTQTMTKTERRSRGMELDVDLGGVEHLGITDFEDYPLVPGAKVDRYRFMSFYLDGSTNHFYDFFNYVVDPEWLMSNDEEARALRQVMVGRANRTWRVLHRVTYVERPALMGFGRDLRVPQGKEQRPWWFPSVGSVQSSVDRLQEDYEAIRQKLDAISRSLDGARTKK